MTQPSFTSTSRRQFLRQTAAGAAVSMAAPAILASTKTDSEVIIGEGEHRFRVAHNLFIAEWVGTGRVSRLSRVP